MPSDPRTEAGKRLAALPFVDGDDALIDLSEDIAEVEAEARAALLDELRGAVAGLTEHPDCLCGPEPSPTVSRAAVLALLDDHKGAAR